MSRQNRRTEHCTDETLIRQLDLELEPAEADRVRLHLGACWNCRARLNDLSETIHSVATLARDDVFPGPGSAEAAKQRFLAAIQARQAVVPLPIRAANRFRTLPAWATAAAAIFVMTLAGIGLLRRPGTPPTATEQQLSATAAMMAGRIAVVEAAGVPKHVPVVQTWHVDLRETKPPGRSASATMELWSDTDARHSGLRWLDSGGRLVRASLNATPASSRDDDDEPLGWPLAHSGLDWTVLADRLASGLQGRETPLLLIPEFLRFCRRAGVEPVLERSTPRILLAATHQAGDLSLRFWIEADPASLRPVRQGLLVSQGPREFEVVIRPAGQVVTRRIDPSLFVTARLERHADPLTPGVAPVLPIIPPVRAAPDTSALEMEVRFALSRATANTNEPLAVEPRADGRILIRGVVPSVRRRDEIQLALAHTGLRGQVQWTLEVASPPDSTVSQRPARAISRALHAEAWALAQLAQRYDASAASGLSEASAALLRTMVRERLDRIDTQSALFRSVLGRAPGTPVVPGAPPSAWPGGAFILYRHTTALESLVEASSPPEALLNVLDAIGRATASLGSALTSRTEGSRQ